MSRAFASSSQGPVKFKVLVAGGSGLLGDTIINNLRSAASSNKALVDVTVLSRSPSSATPESTDNFKLKYVMWDGETPQLNNSDVEGLTHAINLCGENISEGGETLLAKLGIRSWEEENKKTRVISSRITPTVGIKKWLNANPNLSPNLEYIVAGGVGVYGCDFFASGKDAEDENADTSDRPGFLHEVSTLWENAATQRPPSSNNNHHTTILRIAPVLTSSGGVLGKLLIPFKLGLGGNVGSGTQYFPFISSSDFGAAVVDHIMMTPAKNDRVYNLIAPEHCTNEQFGKELGTQLNRATFFPMPAFVVKILFGEMGEEVLLGGVRAKPTRLLDEGFTFEHPNVKKAIASILN